MGSYEGCDRGLGFRSIRPRVAVVERFALRAEAFGLALGPACEAFPVAVDSAGSLEVALTAVLHTRPSVALVDLDLGPAVVCEDLVAQLANLGIVPIVLLDADADDVRGGECLSRGARGVISRRHGLDVAIAAIRRAAERRPVMDPAAAGRLIAAARGRRVADDRDRRRLASLSPREREVLCRIMSGASAADIARTGHVAEATVRTQVRSILNKLEVGSQLAAVALAYRCNWQPVAGPAPAT